MKKNARNLSGRSLSRILSKLSCLIAAVLVTVSLGWAQTSAVGPSHWVATWGTAELSARISASPAARGAQPPVPAPTPAAPPAATAAPAPVAPPPVPVLTGLNNQTLRMIVHTSIGGDTVRIRLLNAFGAATATVGAAHIAVRAKDSAIVSGTDRALTFSGKPTATMYAGQELVSDPVKLTVAPLSDLAISLYFTGDTGTPTNHPSGLHPAYVSKEGDFTGAAEIADPLMVTQSYYWIQGVDVLAPADAATIVAFGDSITDGARSTSDTNSMWPAFLAARLQADKSMANISVVNAGISGNRILGDNVGGVVRISRDAIDVPGVKWIILLEGINDISFAMRQVPLTFSADDLIAAYRQVIAAAHIRGIKVIGCTLTPYGGSGGYKDAGEAIREAANQWIRTSGEFDAVVDFEAATRDSADPKRFRAEAGSPDMLHPGDPGYKLMADAIDLKIFSTNPASKSGKSTKKK